jgi:WD40 repeat protein
MLWHWLLAGLLCVVGLSAAQSEQKPAGEASKSPRLDLHDDALPPGAIARLGTLRFRAPGETVALAFAPDGKTVAVSSHGGLFLFDAASGKKTKRLAELCRGPMMFSPAGARLACGGWWEHAERKAVVRVWELAAEQKPRDYNAEHVIWLGWSADSEPSAVCLEKEAVSLRELAAGRSRRFECANLRRPELSEYVLCACAPAGRTLAVADEENVIHVWDTASGKERCTVRADKTQILRGLAASPDGRHLALLKQDHAAPHGHAVRIVDAGVPENNHAPPSAAAPG